MSSAKTLDSNCHRDPSGRRLPARPMNSRWLPPASRTDASLSRQQTWPVDRDNGPVWWPAGADCAVRSGRRLPLAVPIPGAARGRSARRSGDLDHIERKAEAEHGIAHKLRPENAPTATSSMPPNTGHGSQAVVKVQSSDGIGDPEGSGVGALGPSLFGRPGFLAQAGRAGPAPGR